MYLLHAQYENSKICMCVCILCNINTIFSLFLQVKNQLDSVDIEEFTFFLRIHHEFHPKTMHDVNLKCIPYVKNTSLLQDGRLSKRQSKNIKDNIQSALDR